MGKEGEIEDIMRIQELRDAHCLPVKAKRLKGEETNVHRQRTGRGVGELNRFPHHICDNVAVTTTAIIGVMTTVASAVSSGVTVVGGTVINARRSHLRKQGIINDDVGDGIIVPRRIAMGK